MKKVLILLLLTTVSLISIKSYSQKTEISQFSGVWYYTLMQDAGEAVFLVVKGKDFKSVDGVWDRKGVLEYSKTSKKIEIKGFTDADNEPAYITIKKGIAYIQYTNSWTNKIQIKILTRVKHSASWYDNEEKKMEAISNF